MLITSAMEREGYWGRGDFPATPRRRESGLDRGPQSTLVLLTSTADLNSQPISESQPLSISSPTDSRPPGSWPHPQTKGTLTHAFNGTPLHYSCLESPMDGGAWWAAVHGVAKSRTRLNDFTFTFHFHVLDGTPLQCSCLENPRDGRAWWAALYGVAPSRTRLKRLSSSSRLSRLRKWHTQEQRIM